MIKFRYKRKEPNNNVEKHSDKDAKSDAAGKRLNTAKKTALAVTAATTVPSATLKIKEIKNEKSLSQNIREDYLECIRAVVVSLAILSPFRSLCLSYAKRIIEKDREHIILRKYLMICST